MKSALLYLIACSNTKIAGGAPRYGSERCIARVLADSSQCYLMGTRRIILNHIRQGGSTRQGKELRELPYNSDLRDSRDFRGEEQGLFLPAHSRYVGRLYSEISEGAWENRKHLVLIVSGLYGLLLPDEPIQLYSLDLRDSRITNDVWEDGLSLLLEEYVKGNRINVIVDCIGEKSYRSVFDWDHIRNIGDVFHIFGSQNAGPSVLRAVGSFLDSVGLRWTENELIGLFKSDKGHPTKYEIIHFLPTVDDAKRLGLPTEESDETHINTLPYVPFEERPLELGDIARSRAHEIALTYKALDQWKELPVDVRAKIPKTLNQFVVNPRHHGLGAEKINRGKESFIRIRIDSFYRIHLERQEDKLLIRDIGPHRLEGVD